MVTCDQIKHDNFALERHHKVIAYYTYLREASPSDRAVFPIRGKPLASFDLTTFSRTSSSKASVHQWSLDLQNLWQTV
ncbi:hypothetical protein K1719_007150 [Acacia pycnantha]|nr:hypothetical protein K1719_007150 [Acacia pycnantha]